MELWIELQNSQNSTKDTILRHLTMLSTDSIDSELLLKSEDFLQIFLTTVTSFNQICDISLKFILKILNLSLKKNSSDVHFYKSLLDQSDPNKMKESMYKEDSDKFVFEENSSSSFKNLEKIGVVNQQHLILMMIFIDKNLDRFNSDSDFLEIFISILGKLKGSLREICTLGTLKRVEKFLRKFFDGKKIFEKKIQDVLEILLLKLRIEIVHQNFDISFDLLKNIFENFHIGKLEKWDQETILVLKFWIEFFDNRPESKEKISKILTLSYPILTNLLPALNLKVSPNPSK